MSSIKIFRNNEEKTAILFLLPAIFIIIGLIGYPFVYSIFLSLTDTTVGKPGVFVGLSNFVKLIANPNFKQVLVNSIVYSAFAVVIKLTIGLLVAAFIKNIVGKWSKFIKGAILLPWVVPSSLSAIAWWWMFNPQFSVLNWIIQKILPSSRGLPWLADSQWAMFSVILVNVWRGVPFFAISFLAGLLSIDEDLYEAASTEGANGIQKFFYISLPLLKSILAVVLLFSTLMTISEFNIIYVITKGGPMNSTHLLATYALQEGIKTGNISRGAAISLFLFPILFITSYFQIKVVRRGVRK